MKYKRIAIIGGGLAGCCIAAALQKQCEKKSSSNVFIDLYERKDRLMDAASTHNEGKLHLGYTYAMDKSFATASTMARHALQFEPLMRKWFGSDMKSVPVSTPFHYAIHSDGLLTPSEYYAFANKVGDYVKDAQSSQHSYFGAGLAQKPQMLSNSDVERRFGGSVIVGAVLTNEISIDPWYLAEVVRSGMAHFPNVSLHTSTYVQRISSDRSSYTLHLKEGSGVRKSDPYNLIINASWSDRLRIDAQMSVQTEKTPLFRSKYLVRADRIPENLPTTTVVLGAYGDVVSFDTLTLLSWYPVGRLHWHEGVSPPELNSVLTDQAQIKKIRRGRQSGLSSIIPRLTKCRLENVKVVGDWIYAPGTSDVSDPATRLHNRSAIGAQRFGNFITVNTGKYTSAPYIASQLVNSLI